MRGGENPPFSNGETYEMLAVRQRCRHGCRDVPGCGTAIPTAAEAATLTQPGPALAYRFEAARWTMADRIAGGATLVLFISLFLPWFSVSAGFGNFTASSSVDALTAHGYLYLVLLLALAMLGYLFVYAGLDNMPALPLRHEQILAAAAAVNLLLVLIGMLAMPGGGSSLVKVSWDFGAFLGLAAAIVAVAPLAAGLLRARSGRTA
jgi:hypothetical protein